LKDLAARRLVRSDRTTICRSRRPPFDDMVSAGRTRPEVKETVMRYLCVFKGEEGVPPSAELQAGMGKLIGEMVQAGVLLSTEGCQPSAKGFRMRRTGKRITVTDGPFTESKEVIGGFALIQVKSRDEAIEWCTRFLNVVGDGESEIRLLHENPAV
jgi:hypothetical protein